SSINSFTGMSYVADTAAYTNPPDSCGASGTTSYVETVNNSIRLYTSKDGSQSVTKTFSDFFRSEGSNPDFIDPMVVWDDCQDPTHPGQLVNRFIVGCLDRFNGQFDLAVSASASPLSLTGTD